MDDWRPIATAAKGWSAIIPLTQVFSGLGRGRGTRTSAYVRQGDNYEDGL